MRLSNLGKLAVTPCCCACVFRSNLACLDILRPCQRRSTANRKLSIALVFGKSFLETDPPESNENNPSIVGTHKPTVEESRTRFLLDVAGMSYFSKMTDSTINQLIVWESELTK